MEPSEMADVFDQVFDHALVFHAFADHMRDYEMVFFTVADPRTGIPPAHLRYRFRHCVEARTETTVAPETWRGSLDDSLLEPELGDAVDAYHWGIRWQVMYPGARLARRSTQAARWTDALGLPFHEAVVETNAHKITLVFHDLEVAEVAPGYVPFQVD